MELLVSLTICSCYVPPPQTNRARYAYAMLVAAEATVGAITLDYWKTAVPATAWITIILVVILFLNIVACIVLWRSRVLVRVHQADHHYRPENLVVRAVLWRWFKERSAWM